MKTPKELASSLRYEADKSNGVVKYSTAMNAAKAIDLLLAWVTDEGERTNVCTKSVTGVVCSYCACKKATP
jgi:hypothetical protein